MLLLFGPVTLICFPLYCGVKDLFSSQIVKHQSSLRATGLSIHTGSVCLCRGSAATSDTISRGDQRRSEISPLAASETFTQRRMQRLGT